VIRDEDDRHVGALECNEILQIDAETGKTDSNLRSNGRYLLAKLPFECPKEDVDDRLFMAGYSRTYPTRVTLAEI
jgi:hypothetical protein